MAFLDNSGDIILDAVLTDAGRKRLAQGDGTFRVVKFALADDEIDYGLFDKAHPSGSAYYDLEIMQTPILEAFTNNTSSLKHRLMSMTQTNLLYLPVMKPHSNYPGMQATNLQITNGQITSASPVAESTSTGEGVYILPADGPTSQKLSLASEALQVHHLNPNSAIGVVQGIDSEEISFKREMGNLVETQYIIQSDYRMLRLTDRAQANEKAESYIDDDMIASYYFSENVDGTTFISRTPWGNRSTNDVLNDNELIIKGPQGTRINFNFIPSMEIETSSSLFDELGSNTVLTIGATEYAYLDTNVRVTGATTGTTIDIPIRIMKLKP